MDRCTMLPIDLTDACSGPQYTYCKWSRTHVVYRPLRSIPFSSWQGQILWNTPRWTDQLIWSSVCSGMCKPAGAAPFCQALRVMKDVDTYSGKSWMQQKSMTSIQTGCTLWCQRQCLLHMCLMMWNAHGDIEQVTETVFKLTEQASRYLPKKRVNKNQ